MNNRAWLWHYINEVCIHRVKPGEPLLDGKAPGTKYSWQFYLRRGLTNTEFLWRVCAEFWHLFEHQEFQVTGMETGATPLVIAIAMSAPRPVNAFITRAEEKKYGLKNRFEGIIQPGVPVLVVDDLAASQNTMFNCMKHVEAKGLPLAIPFFAIIDKDVSSHKYGEMPPVFTLFKASDFPLEYADYHGSKSQ